MDDRSREARVRRRLKPFGLRLEKQRSPKFRGEWWVWDEHQGCQTVLRLHASPHDMLEQLEAWLDECEAALLQGWKPEPWVETWIKAQSEKTEDEWSRFEE